MKPAGHGTYFYHKSSFYWKINLGSDLCPDPWMEYLCFYLVAVTQEGEGEALGRGGASPTQPKYKNRRTDKACGFLGKEIVPNNFGWNVPLRIQAARIWGDNNTTLLVKNVTWTLTHLKSYAVFHLYSFSSGSREMTNKTIGEMKINFVIKPHDDLKLK